MRRFSPILRRILRRRLASGEFTGKEAQYINRLLSARGKARSLAWDQINAECATLKGCTAACLAADQEDSNRPIFDWILRNLDTIISIVIAVILQLLL
jgi:hypothetical protein